MNVESLKKEYQTSLKQTRELYAKLVAQNIPTIIDAVSKNTCDIGTKCHGGGDKALPDVLGELVNPAKIDEKVGGPTPGPKYDTRR